MPVTKQHVVSQVVLRRWCDQTRNLVSHRVENGRVRKIGPAGVGRIDGLVRPDLSDEAEARWRKIEDRAGEAIEHVTSSDLPPDEITATALRDLLALHLLRSRDSDERWAKALHEIGRSGDVLEMLDDPAVLTRLVYERRGIYAAGPEILDAEREHHLARLDHRVGIGGAGFVEASFEILERLRGILNSHSVQIGRAETPKQLLISDAPALTVDTETGRIGFRNGVTVNDANQIVMPIDPHHIMALGKEPAWFQLPADTVDLLNGWQLWNSRAVVMYSTDSELGSWVDDWRGQHVHPDDRDRRGGNPNRRGFASEA